MGVRGGAVGETARLRDGMGPISGASQISPSSQALFLVC